MAWCDSNPFMFYPCSYVGERKDWSRKTRHTRLRIEGRASMRKEGPTSLGMKVEFAILLAIGACGVPSAIILLPMSIYRAFG